MSKGLTALKGLQRHKYGTLDEFDKKLSIIEAELKEHEQQKELLKKIFAKDSDLCLEGWKHLDGHLSYHIVVNEGEDLDIEISKEDYDLLVRYRDE